MTNYYRQPSLKVEHKTTTLTDVFGADVRASISARIASAEVRVATLPTGIQPWDAITITMGASLATAAVRFTGYYISADRTLFPEAVVLNCRGKLELPNTLETNADVDLSSGGTGATDEVMVSTILYTCRSSGAWTPAEAPTAMTNIGGTGETLGTVSKSRGFTWSAGTSGMAAIDMLDNVCLGYRTYDTFDGTIKRTLISTIPAESASATFTEHVDIVAAKENRTISGARNRVIVTGYPGANSNAAITYTAIGSNPFLVSTDGQWYLTSSLNSPMIEKQNTASAGDGLSCEEVASWRLGELNRYIERVELTTPRDDVVEPGDTIAVVSPTRLGITSRNFWVESVTIAIGQDGAFSQSFACLAALPLTDSINGAVLAVVASATGAAIAPSVLVVNTVEPPAATATATGAVPVVGEIRIIYAPTASATAQAYIATMLGYDVGVTAVTATATAQALAPSQEVLYALLLETGDVVLLETGDKTLLE